MTLNHPPALPPLYLLVEETSRELNSRILLATVGAEAGFISHIIPQWFAWENFRALPQGVVLFKGNNATQSAHMIDALDAGHRVAALEEEILGLTGDMEILRHFQSEHVGACELFVLQGEHARAIVAARHPDLAGRMVVTGNPRADLLRAPFDGPIRREAETIRERQGDYILVNTNFGATNPVAGDTIAFRALCIRVGILDPENQRDCDAFIARCEWERENMALLARLIAKCAASPTLPKLIIRPHPAENIAKWREAYAGQPRVSIIRDGDHAPWTAAARLLLHTGCTTGVEAALMGTPVLSLRGGKSLWHDHMMSNHVNHVATDENQAFALIQRHFEGDADAVAPTGEMSRELGRQLQPSPDGSAAGAIIAALRGFAGSFDAAAEESRSLSRVTSRKVVFSDDKVGAATFNAPAVAASCARYARDLGHAGPPVVGQAGEAIITVAPPDRATTL